MCYSCDKELQLYYFDGHGSAKDGLAGNCQDCALATRKQKYTTATDMYQYKTEKQLLKKGYDEFCNKVEEFRRLSEIY